ACTAAGPSRYGPITGGFGYSAEKVDESTWQVRYAGSRLTPRETIEAYALHRAAEIALENGFEKFAVLDRTYEVRTDRTYAYAIQPPGFPLPDARNHGVTAYSDPCTSTRLVTTETRLAALTVRPFRDAPPAGAQRVYDARAEIARLGPAIRRR